MNPNPALITDIGNKPLVKIKAQARNTGKSVQRLLDVYAQSAMIRRIFMSEYADEFALKGGMTMWMHENMGIINGRATSDVDISCLFTCTVDELRERLIEILGAPGDDGVAFDLSTLIVKSEDDRELLGVKLAVRAQVGGAVVPVKSDILIDSYCNLPLVPVEWPAVVEGLPSFRVMCVPVESMVADKLHAAWRHRGKVTRMRDFYDLWLIMSKPGTDFDMIAKALVQAFQAYGHELPEAPKEWLILGPDKRDALKAGWQRMLQEKPDIAARAPDFETVVMTVQLGLARVLGSITAFEPAGMRH